MITRPHRARRVIPRWHSPTAMARRYEVQGIGRGRPITVEKPLLNPLIADWESCRHDVFASDLVGAALLFEDIAQAREAAEFLLGSPTASVASRRLAARYLARYTGTTAVRPGEDAATVSEVRHEIQSLRTRAAINPHDGLLWVERARQYTLIGQAAQAAHAMRVAIALDPDDRYVLRSAARLHVHVGESAEAHRILLRSPRTATDPWLIAAEIATATLAERSPHFVKAGRDALERGLDPRHTTELASSLATLELEAGNSKRAKALFKTSLTAPNDNALAQAEWASSHVHFVDLPGQFDRVPDSWEARALNAADEGDLATAVDQTFLWLDDQPYSTEAAIFGSYQASKDQGFESGAEFARRGLMANPRDPMLLNNLAFCLAKLDRVDEAAQVLDRVPAGAAAASDDGVTARTATRGLIALRRGEHDLGVQLYTEAIEHAADPARRTIAFLMLISELLRIQPTEREQLSRLATEEAGRASDPETSAWLRHLDSGQASLSPDARARAAVQRLLNERSPDF